MKILDFLSLIHRYVKRFSDSIVTFVFVFVLALFFAFFLFGCSCSTSCLTPEEIYLRGAEDISRDFDKDFNRVLGTNDSIHIIGFRLWKHSNMTERVSR